MKICKRTLPPISPTVKNTAEWHYRAVGEEKNTQYVAVGQLVIPIGEKLTNQTSISNLKINSKYNKELKYEKPNFKSLGRQNGRIFNNLSVVQDCFCLNTTHMGKP